MLSSDRGDLGALAPWNAPLLLDPLFEDSGGIAVCQQRLGADGFNDVSVGERLLCHANNVETSCPCRKHKKDAGRTGTSDSLKYSGDSGTIRP